MGYTYDIPEDASLRREGWTLTVTYRPGFLARRFLGARPWVASVDAAGTDWNSVTWGVGSKGMQDYVYSVTGRHVEGRHRRAVRSILEDREQRTRKRHALESLRREREYVEEQIRRERVILPEARVVEE